MVLNQTTLGELYQSLSQEEVKGLEGYLQKNTSGKNNILLQLHKLMTQAKLQTMLAKLDTDYIKSELFGGDAKSVSKLTTYNNLLINHIKDYLILSKIKEKNIYTETLWGEILIERGLKRNLQLKLTNFKFNQYIDEYALMKKFFHDRETFFYSYLTRTKKNHDVMFNNLMLQAESFKNYVQWYMFETYYSLLSFSKTGKLKLDLNEISEYVKNTIPSSNKLIRLNQLNLNLELTRSGEAYFELKDFFLENISLWSKEIYIQLVPVINNYIQTQIYKGNESMEKDNYSFFSLLYQNKILFKTGVFTIVRLANFIRLELMFGKIESVEQLLEESLKVLAPAQKDSFQYLIESRIAFAKEDYKLSLRKISIINPSDSIYYFPQYKIMLIKNYVMLADIDRLASERENFYKYINNNKNIQEDEKRRHKLYIKYAEYLTSARYEYLTDYMKKRIENALLPSSPYFTEKQWVRERWEELKGNE